LRANGTGGSTIQSSGVTVSDNNAVAITIADTANEVGLTVTQNDVTNNRNALHIISGATISSTTSAQHPLRVQTNSGGNIGAFVALYHNSASPAVNDQIGGFGMFGKNSADEETNYGGFSVLTSNVTDGSETAYGSFYTIQNGTPGVYMLDIGNGVNGISVGSGSAAGVVESYGNQDLTLQTGNSTTGTITITDGANGNINIAPNGAGEAQVGGDKIVTEDATQTLTAKTLTNPALTSQALSDGATISWNWNSGTFATVTLGGNRTLAAPTNLTVGKAYLKVTQDGTGGRTLNVNTNYNTPGGINVTLTTTAGAVDILEFMSDGTNVYLVNVTYAQG
jgi:hypothetical protein